MALDPKQVASSNLYALTEADRSKFKELYQDFIRRYGMPRDSRGGPRAETDDAQQAPEVYVAYLTSGISARVGNAPGYADCTVYQVTPDVNDEPELSEVVGFTHRVHNVSGSALSGGEWAIVWRDKYGTWFTGLGSGGGGAGGFWARLISKGYDGTCPVYGYRRIIPEAFCGRVWDDTDIEGTCHEVNEVDLPVLDCAEQVTGTGTGSGSGTDNTRTCPTTIVWIHTSQDPLPEVDTGTGTGTGTAPTGTSTTIPYTFVMEPRIDIVEMTEDPDSNGEASGVLLRYAGGSLIAVREIIIIDVNEL